MTSHWTYIAGSKADHMLSDSFHGIHGDLSVEVVWRFDLEVNGCVPFTPETNLWFQGLVNLVKELTDSSMCFTAMKTSTMCIDLANLIKSCVR